MLCFLQSIQGNIRIFQHRDISQCQQFFHFLTLPCIPIGQIFKGSVVCKCAEGRHIRMQTAAAGKPVLAALQCTKTATLGANKQHRLHFFRTAVALVNHRGLLLALPGIFINIPADDLIDLLCAQRFQLFRGVNTGDAALHFTTTNTLAPARCRQIATLQAVGNQAAATHFHQPSGGCHNIGRAAIPAGLAFGKNDHRSAVPQFPQAGHSGIGTTDALTAGNGIESISQKLAEQALAEHMLTGHKVHMIAGRT